METAAKNGVWYSPDNSAETVAEHCHWYRCTQKCTK